ncbi:L,D-transpeptidase family protein [Marinobacterium arenosum]|uniref:L,D-transpeptidase family protein n=1 Tax=Marinobacterium arenosum TaxID=2862496 RepID=UPI001C967EC3|nr:L,D-transpeptidase family protein [Marinobacterium arenosum]MBY4676277.1 L,D-transpeptidase family protein [Marinobacterium arenosum]
MPHLPLLILTCLLGALLSAPGNAASYRLASDEGVIGTLQMTTASADDTLVRIARRHNLGYREMVLANHQTDRWLPEPGGLILLPTQHVLPKAPRRGIVINLAEMRLYYFPAERTGEVWTYPVGIGREGWQTPRALTHISAKIEAPSWTPPESIRQEYSERGIELPASIPAGPDNPLGSHALRLALPGYLLHGTNRPAGVGMKVSHGCIRLYPEDIASLFAEVRVETPVRIVDQPFKLGWQDGLLFLEVSRPDYPIAEAGHQGIDMNQLVDAIIAATPEQDAHIDWQLVEQIAKQADGVPAAIGYRRRTDRAAGRQLTSSP